jgi:hypothetical protein
MTKPFWVFAFSHYYPGGGLNDLVEMCATREDAEEVAAREHADETQIIDVRTARWVNDKHWGRRVEDDVGDGA